MKITKFEHSCLMVEMPAPVNRTVLFDPGKFSEAIIDVEDLEFLDDIIITHQHSDHMSIPLLKQLTAKFPNARITAPNPVVELLAGEGINAASDPSAGIEFFKSPHEKIEPFSGVDTPPQIGVHYLNMLTHPGDSHSFKQTMPILALPVQAPWGSARRALELALKLKPQYVLPIHDWHWSQAGRQQMYEKFATVLAEQGIEFIMLKNGEPKVIEV